MELTKSQHKVIEQVINCFETSRIDGNYSAVALLADSPTKTKQVTYGRSQVTEFGNLKALLQSYHGEYATELAQYIPKIRDGSLASNIAFITLLKNAGKDPVMQACQDAIFDEHYFKPAERWADSMGFTLPLSMLVIYDSYIHSGKVRDSLRESFAEKVPASGGDEKRWVVAYCHARRNWLEHADNPLLHATVYRMDCCLSLASLGNWDLNARPIMAHGVMIR